MGKSQPTIFKTSTGHEVVIPKKIKSLAKRIKFYVDVISFSSAIENMNYNISTQFNYREYLQWYYDNYRSPSPQESNLNKVIKNLFDLRKNGLLVRLEHRINPTIVVAFDELGNSGYKR